MTTNPSLVAKSGHSSFIDLIKDICAVVPGPVSAEVAATRVDFFTLKRGEDET